MRLTDVAAAACWAGTAALFVRLLWLDATAPRAGGQTRGAAAEPTDR